MTDNDPSARDDETGVAGAPDPGDTPPRGQPSPWAAPGRAAHPYPGESPRDQQPPYPSAEPPPGEPPAPEHASSGQQPQQPQPPEHAARQQPGQPPEWSPSGRPQAAPGEGPASETAPAAGAQPWAPAGPPPAGQDSPGQQQAGQYQPGQYPPGQYPAGQHPTGQHPQSSGFPAVTYPSYGPGHDPSGQSGRGAGASRRLVAGVALLALLVGGGAGAAGGYFAASTTIESDTANALNEAQPPAEQTSDAPQGSVQAAADKLKPSVVQLQVRAGNSAGEGSGFILSEDGYIMTNNHVIEAAAAGGQITVVFNNGKRADAEVVGRDPTTDIAVVRAEGVSGLDTVELGRSDNLDVGEQVVAIGSPYELAGTVTSGIVSSLHRPVTAGGQGGQATVMDAIQTDAAINPGNSGGPLANMQGKVVGINSAIYSPGRSSGPGQSAQGGNVGIGFAIPIDQARRTANEIIEKGYATQTFIGAGVGNAKSGGSVIREVHPGTPAEKSGLQAGDVIVKVDDRVIKDANTLVAAIRTRAPGEQVTFTLADGSTVKATLGGKRVQPN